METKICTKCKLELSLDLFCVHKREKDGHDCYCKKCKAGMDKTYRENNKDKIKISKHLSYVENKDRVVERVEKYRKNNIGKYRAYNGKSKLKLKNEVFRHYCGGEIRCKICGESDLSLLTMDHINGGGNKHRKKIGGKTSYDFNVWLKRNSYPDGFQILCWTCQFRKRNEMTKPANPTKRQQQKMDNYRLLKKTCLEHYGSICPCGEDDIEVLTLDHVNDDGKSHRDKVGAGASFYCYLRKNNFPNDPPLQVLCIKCQYRKRNEWYEKRKRR